jgi:uncharacterized membrane protein YkoI
MKKHSRHTFVILLATTALLVVAGPSFAEGESDHSSGEHSTSGHSSTDHSGSDRTSVDHSGSTESTNDTNQTDVEDGTGDTGSIGDDSNIAATNAINSTNAPVEQDEARQAVAAGKAASLPLVLAFMAINYPGEVIDVKLHQRKADYVYEVKFLAEANMLRSVVLDAKTLKKN